MNEDFKLTFGKYNGKTLGEICNIDPSYLFWLDDNVIPINEDLLDRASELIDRNTSLDLDDLF